MGSRSVEKGNAAIASIAEEAPETKGMISVVQLDVQDDASVKAAAESIKASLGGEPLFAIVNNAGAGLAHGVDTGPILDVNLYGVKRVCDAIVPLLGPKGSRIVNVGSGIFIMGYGISPSLVEELVMHVNDFRLMSEPVGRVC